MSTTFPDENAIDAFVLTFRFFIQDNERCSFGNLGDAYSKLLVPEEIEQYTEARQKLNEYLDSNVSFTLTMNTSAEEKFSTFLYTAVSHMRTQKRKRYMTNGLEILLSAICFSSNLFPSSFKYYR